MRFPQCVIRRPVSVQDSVLRLLGEHGPVVVPASIATLPFLVRSEDSPDILAEPPRVRKLEAALKAEVGMTTGQYIGMIPNLSI